ncbi:MULTISPECIES: L-threonylcarbamoyladenylate synthase [unclassified Streptomyces]|uniref:L-threonylcarbamoyladenylate synthase n=1 Tax=unclassified Streptomyces TaxID=2593676 RepID=UPI001BE8C3F2|nr:MULTISPECIES: Sua5/YciO/YrdC/YwlC family protein [unclassified Streptomyces]MBT2404623.1 Sua5/YciO/YrdC/YwlC family protein [Streptomyces sp. ISL-21]MBT2610506.1 Sua5/YciO/YrdC/YwlC family protein [Streptomyces sp. ISL-87]
MQIIPTTDIDTAAAAIEAGRLVIVPTARWYMICADAANPDAYKAILEGKQRPKNKPLALVVPDQERARDLLHFTPDAERLATAFWPGDLALFLSWREPADAARYTVVGSPALTTHAPGPLGALARAVPGLLAATTVNVSGDAGPDDRGPAITLAEVEEFLTEAGLDAVVMDGGVCPAANHLTIVDCASDQTHLVRAGLVHPRAVASVIGRTLPTP